MCHEIEQYLTILWLLFDVGWCWSWAGENKAISITSRLRPFDDDGINVFGWLQVAYFCSLTQVDTANNHFQALSSAQASTKEEKNNSKCLKQTWQCASSEMGGDCKHCTLYYYAEQRENIIETLSCKSKTAIVSSTSIQNWERPSMFCTRILPAFNWHELIAAVSNFVTIV